MLSIFASTRRVEAISEGRYDSADPERVLAMVEQAYKLAMASKPPRKRKDKKGNS